MYETMSEIPWKNIKHYAQSYFLKKGGSEKKACLIRQRMVVKITVNSRAVILSIFCESVM